MKESTAFICRAPNKGNGQLTLKRPELPVGFQARVFKGNMWMRFTAPGLSSDWLVVR